MPNADCRMPNEERGKPSRVGSDLSDLSDTSDGDECRIRYDECVGNGE